MPAQFVDLRNNDFKTWCQKWPEHVTCLYNTVELLTWNLCIIGFHSKLIANRLNLLILITNGKGMGLLASFFKKKKRLPTLISLYVKHNIELFLSLLHCFWPFISLYHQLNKGSSKHSTLVHNWASKVKFTSITHVMCPLVVLYKINISMNKCLKC